VRRRRRGRLTPSRRGGFCHCHGAGCHSRLLARRPVPWTGRRYATGCIATTRMLGGWRTGPGLASASSGRSPAERVAKWVEDGPDLKTDGVVRWRCADLRDRIAAKSMFICMSAASASCLKKLNFSSMSVRLCTRKATLRHRRLLKKLR